MTGPEQYALFDRIRETAGLRLADVVAELLPRIADEIRSSVDDAIDLQTEMALTEAALVLRDEIELRTESAVGKLDEFHFLSLQEATDRDSPSHRQSGFELITEAALTDQIVGQNLASRARESLEEAYPAYLSRLAQLTGTEADEDRCPLGAKALGIALVSALRPYSSDPLTRERVEIALQKHAVIPIREIIAAADRKMVEQGVLSTLPRIVVFPGLRKAVEGAVARSARGSASVVVGADSPVEAGDPVAADVPVVAPSTQVTPADPGSPLVAAANPADHGELAKRDKSAVAESAIAEPAVAEPVVAEPVVAEPTDQPSTAVDKTPQTAALPAEVVTAARQIVRDVKASMVLGAHPIVGHRDRRSAFRHAAMLPTIDSLERDAIAFAHQVGHPPFSAPARHAFFSQMRGQMKQAGVDSAQLATLDLVSAMFDYATDNDRIPDPARPLIWRLQLPSVTLACLDIGYLGDEPRSVRRLVEHVAAIATAYPDDVSRGSELHGRLQTVVRAVEVVAHAFQVRSQVLSEQVRIEYQRATYGMGQLVSKVSRERNELEANAGRRNRRDYRRRPSREREIEVGGRIERLLSERLQDREVPDTVAEFLKGVWLRHLRTAVLRDGEESPGYQAALKVVDDLLWTIDGNGERRSRNELAQRIPDMLKILTQGISDIGAKAEDYRPFFDEMFLIHLRRMQKRRKPSKSGAASSAASGTAAGAASELPVLSDPIASADVEALPLDDIVLAPAEEVLRPSSAVPSDEMTAAPVSRESAAALPARRTAARVDDAAPAASSPKAKATPSSRDLDMPGEGAVDAKAADPVAAVVPKDAVVRKDAVEQEDAGGRDPVGTRSEQTEADAQTASELKLRRLIDNTTLDDVPRHPVRMEIEAEELGRDLAPGQWLELITSTRKRILAKVAWINERRSVVLLLQYPDRLILSRHVAALVERAARRRAFRVG